MPSPTQTYSLKWYEASIMSKKKGGRVVGQDRLRFARPNLPETVITSRDGRYQLMVCCKYLTCLPKSIPDKPLAYTLVAFV